VKEIQRALRLISEAGIKAVDAFNRRAAKDESFLIPIFQFNTDLALPDPLVM